ncbi:hypothetical protein MTBLM1_130037 [Rhodospirillaceae bacterium LM-1]|nr:hypothetical protein MTBLM1_130037 [Rhodospirillaceae bacterium LM-1]
MALHEAGHAVIARHFGKNICDVCLYEVEGLYHGKTTASLPQQQELITESESVIVLAGFAAEQHYNPKGFIFDKDFLKSGCKKYASDRKSLDKLLQKLCESEIVNNPDDDCILDRAAAPLFDEAKRLVATPSHWRAIESLAEKLCVSLHVTGKIAMETIDVIFLTDNETVGKEESAGRQAAELTQHAP